ncbi:hypothetical protein [Pseudoneobacillus rhizosphaerae]|uniref:hypothetical protein n=1 Tax=Pseudoneobacillus rhizosphaerae TaxID=2880968 RepID=UPI001E4C7D44|nr:hypothetical protein [Pseudoneobacillus rhizosphaerae]
MHNHFCKYAEKAVLNPIKDSTGKSVHIDVYPIGSNSLERKQVSQTLKMLKKKISHADSARSVSHRNGIVFDLLE